MVIPWIGYSLSEFIKQCDPLPSAKYVQFLSYYDKKIEKWASETTIFWPYSEGLRMIWRCCRQPDCRVEGRHGPVLKRLTRK